MPTHYITIGNTPGYGTHIEAPQWEEFIDRVDGLLAPNTYAPDQRKRITLHGKWASRDLEYTNLCWCIEIEGDGLRNYIEYQLKHLATYYGQESIVFATAQVAFIEGEKAESKL